MQTVILIGCLLALLWLYIQYKWKVLAKYGITGPPPTLRDMGNISGLTHPKFFLNDLKLIKEYGTVIGRYAFASPRIMISDPEILKQVMVKEFRTFSERQDRANKILGKVSNRGLTVTQGEDWKRQRSTLSPTFSSSRMKEIFPILQRCIEGEIASMHRVIRDEGGVLNAKDQFGNISMNCIIQAAFGTDMGDKQTEIAGQMRKLLRGNIWSLPWLMVAMLWRPFEDIMDYFDISVLPTEPIKYFLGLSDAVINMRKAHGSQRVDLLQLMLDSEADSEAISAGKGLTRTEIKAQTMLFIAAGYETTSNTMQFLSYQLATHPDLQEKLRQEINDVVEQHGGDMSYDAIRDMKYLDMCINESLRMYPIVPTNSRVCQREVTVNGVTIPRGVTVDIPVYALSKSPDHWDDPESFIPERMADMSQINPLVFQPFGAGPRNCIGMKFALLEIKLCFARLLQEFRLVPNEDTPSYPVGLSFSLKIMNADQEIIFKIEAI